MDFSRTTHHHSNHHTDPSSSHAQFNIDWNLFHNALIRKKLPQKTHRWYTLRAERFLSYLAKCSISEISDVHVRKYLHAAVSDQRLKDWQARQVVDAIRILCMEVLGGEGFAIDGDSHRFSIDGDCHLFGLTGTATTSFTSSNINGDSHHFLDNKNFVSCLSLTPGTPASADNFYTAKTDPPRLFVNP